MITLHRIHAKNFRSLGEVTVDFDPTTPVVAITGGNGAGKTSLFAALLWALYGLTPDGVNVKELRRQGSEGDTVVAEVTFTHQQQTVTVTRSLTGAQSRTTANINIDGIPVTTVQPRTATQWVEQRLGLDANGFLSAVVVRQKELDALVTLTPKERRARIEHLAGIDSLELAAAAARSEALAAKRAADATPDPDADIIDTEQVITQLTKTVAESQQAVTEAEKRATNANAAFAAVNEHAQRVGDAINRGKTLTDELAAVTAGIAQTQGRVDALRDERDRLTQQVGTADQEQLTQAEAVVADTDSALTALAEKRDELTTIITTATTAQAAAATAAAHEQNLTRQLDTATTAVQKATAHAAALTVPDVPAVAAAVAHLAEQLGAAKGEHARLQQAVTTLQSAGKHASCPTCQQQVTDMSTLLTGLTQDVAAAQERINELAATHTAAQKKEHDARLAATAARDAQAAVTAASDHLKRVEHDQQQASSAARRAADAAQEAANAAANAQTALTEVTREATGLRTQRDTQQAHANELRRLIGEAQRLTQMNTTITQLNTTITEEQQRATHLRNQITDLHLPSEDEQRQLRTQWQDAAGIDKQATAAVETARAHANSVAQQMTTAERDLKRLQEQAVRRADLFRAAEETAHTRDSLNDFRADRLRKLAPELAEIAGEIVAQVTAGRYVTMTLDENFTPTLTDTNGAGRAVSLLSGGEQSVVAFALRVAVGEILTGGAGGLLMLDEVLTAMDDQRRDAMISAIRNLPNRQVVTINHVAESTDIADVTYKVHGEPATVTILTASSLEAPLNLIDA